MTTFWLVDEILSEILVSSDIFVHAKKAVDIAIRKVVITILKKAVFFVLKFKYKAENT